MTITPFTHWGKKKKKNSKKGNTHKRNRNIKLKEKDLLKLKRKITKGIEIQRLKQSNLFPY